ncbi:hypothetical protein D3C74_320820 [compost metagenome]
MRQVDQRLDGSFERHFSDLIQQQREEERDNQVHDYFSAGEEQRIPGNLQEIIVLPHVFEMFQSYPRRA